jgi:hypothetical protein
MIRYGMRHKIRYKIRYRIRYKMRYKIRYKIRKSLGDLRLRSLGEPARDTGGTAKSMKLSKNPSGKPS